jgi:uroporphyrinogen decarboxylase
MSKPFTSRDRIQRMFEHREADRVPIVDLPWDSTIARWRREGLPANADWAEYLDVDCVRLILPDNSPRFPERVIEATSEYRIYTTRWGATRKDWYDRSGALGYLDYAVKDRASWAKAKERMQPSRERIPWGYLASEYPRWRRRGDWVMGVLWFGFEVIYSHMVGTPLFIAMVEDPEWVLDMVNTMLDTSIALLDMVWEAGYHFDGVMWYNDMGFKGTQFMSVSMYRELFKPADRRAAEWAHARGLPVYYHSCGNLGPLVAELVDEGIDMLNPLEVKAGMDPLALKARYGDRLGFHGGLDVRLFDEPERMWAEMERIIPVMKEGGGYIIGTDHSVPDSVSFGLYREFVRRAKELGRYG